VRKNSIFFRAWYYFRQGWSTYFAFIFAAINTLVITYYLAIDKIPVLLVLFPSFIHYVTIMTFIGIPLLVVIGYIHYKKTAAFSSEAEVIVESNPFHYKLPKEGWNAEVVFPFYLALSELMIKWSKNEKLADDDIKNIQELQEKMGRLIKGGFVGNPKKKFV
jgi:hypothetical protein